MKYKSLIFSIILVSVTLLASWTVPALVQKMTDDSHSYPLMYYSARLKELCVIDFREHKNSFYDIHGNEYPRAQYDSLLPLLNYRQLAMEGQLPDSLEGQAIDSENPAEQTSDVPFSSGRCILSATRYGGVAGSHAQTGKSYASRRLLPDGP